MANDNTAVFALILVGIVAVIGLFALRPMSGYYAVSDNSTAGLLNITIGTALSITLTDALVDFGTGYVNSGSTFAIVDSNVSAAGDNWTSTAGGAGGWPASTDYLTLENNGNVDANVSVSASKSAATFLGGTSPAQNYSAQDNQAGSCTGTLQTTTTELKTTQTSLCTNLTYASANDALDIAFQLKVPSDATPAGKTNTITFSAVQA